MEDDSPPSRWPPFQHRQRLVQGVQHVRVAAFLAQHPQRVNHQIRTAGKVLDVVSPRPLKRDHRRLAGIRRQQLRKQDAGAAQLIDHRS